MIHLEQCINIQLILQDTAFWHFKILTAIFNSKNVILIFRTIKFFSYLNKDLKCEMTTTMIFFMNYVGDLVVG